MLFLDSLRREFQLPNSPVAVMFSGGKDSTLLLQLVAEVQLQLPLERRKPVYIVTADTSIENPLYHFYLLKKVSEIERFAEEEGLPWQFEIVTPPPHQTFFSLLIGRGYPAPNRDFRWCTSRLKEKPINRRVEELLRREPQLVLLIGARRDESARRRRSIEKWEQMEERIPKLRPIANWTTGEVWEYLRQNRPPWGSHRDLFQLYLQGSGPRCQEEDLGCCRECSPRFGCWTCTVVKRDFSLENFAIRYPWLEPLLEFRNWIAELRNDPGAREPTRRDGGSGLGPFKVEVRRQILERLLEVERGIRPHLLTLFSQLDSHSIPPSGLGRVGEGVTSPLLEGRLISDLELEAIDHYWRLDRYWESPWEVGEKFGRRGVPIEPLLLPEEVELVRERGFSPEVVEGVLGLVASRELYWGRYWPQLEELVIGGLRGDPGQGLFRQFSPGESPRMEPVKGGGDGN
jgi:DNA sulfur modification protein DndC